jgi:hypothetical protein
LLLAVAAAALAAAGGGAWLYGHQPASEAPLQAEASTPWPVALPNPAPAASAVPPAGGASVPAPVPNYSAMAKQAMEQARSPAEALRKVQLSLNGGTPQQALEAAQTLQMCSVMSGVPEALYAMRDRPGDMPEPVKKMMDGMGGISKEMIENSQSEARRCQVFDAATLARRKELFQRAYEGEAEGGAAAYLSALQNPLEKEKADPALIAKLQADVRKAAAGGDADALLQMAMATGDSARELGVTPAQRVGYKAAWKLIQDERFPGVGMADIMDKAMAPFDQAKSSTPLSAAEQAEADAMTQQAVEAWRRKRKG